MIDVIPVEPLPRFWAVRTATPVWPFVEEETGAEVRETALRTIEDAEWWVTFEPD